MSDALRPLSPRDDGRPASLWTDAEVGVSATVSLAPKPVDATDAEWSCISVYTVNAGLTLLGTSAAFRTLADQLHAQADWMDAEAARQGKPFDLPASVGEGALEATRRRMAEMDATPTHQEAHA